MFGDLEFNLQRKLYKEKVILFECYCVCPGGAVQEAGVETSTRKVLTPPGWDPGPGIPDPV